jgi:hypothetical protein
MTSEEPLTYRDATWDRRRNFELFGDRIRVRVKSQAFDAETDVHLINLNPDPEKLFVRQQVPFQLAILLIVLAGGIGIGAFASGADRISGAVVIAVSLAILGATILMYFGKKIEFMRFKTNADAVILDVARSGPDKQRFDDFVTDLVARIRDARNGDALSEI